jgi:transposase
MTSVDHLPNDAESLKRLLLAREEELVAAREAQAAAEAEAARALAKVSSAEAMIAHYKLAIEKLRWALYGQRSERGERLLGQMELQLEELEATATEDALAAETADGTTVRSFSASWCPARQPARAAARTGWPRSARTSPRRWRSCPGSGR